MKLYYNNIEIGICLQSPSNVEANNHIIINNNYDLIEFTRKLNDDSFENDICLQTTSDIDVLSELKNIYRYLEAAGGIVKSENGKFLIIKRWGIWDLPKGKIEEGEVIRDAAIREVVEETGINSLIIDKELPDTFHVYNRKGKWYLKKTYWYQMTTLSSKTPVPQLEEDITEAIWMTKSEARDAISNSYRSIYDNLGFVFESGIQ